ncbi:uncharacterized protein LOC135848362 [Planococcus citri]|uniref:uncharacterized protein LOC135848362 n=1 Tax=Planococcus citri TaxID=170843 RepID=UPI0031F860AA
MYRTSGTFVGLLLLELLRLLTNCFHFLGLLGSTLVTVSAEKFNLANGKAKIKEILTYLYEDVLKQQVPNFQSINNASDFDGLSTAAESFLNDSKIEEIKNVAADHFPEISQQIQSYLNILAAEMEDDDDTKNETIPLSGAIAKITPSYAHKHYEEPDPADLFQG